MNRCVFPRVVYASDDTGTWTVTVTLPDGMTCLVASGNAYEGFENVPPVLGTAL